MSETKFFGVGEKKIVRTHDDGTQDVQSSMTFGSGPVDYAFPMQLAGSVPFTLHRVHPTHIDEKARAKAVELAKELARALHNEAERFAR